ADDLLIIPRVHAAIRERGVRPYHGAAGVAVCRFQDVGAVDLVVALRCEPRDDQVAFLVEDEPAPAGLTLRAIRGNVRDEERVAPAHFLAAGGGEGLPQPLTGVRFQAAKLAVTPDAVDVAVQDDRRGHEAVETVSEA